MTDEEFIKTINNCSSIRELLVIALEDRDFILTNDDYYRDFRSAWLDRADELIKSK